MHVVAREAGKAAPVHDALHEVIALHAVLVGCTVGEIVEAVLSKRTVFATRSPLASEQRGSRPASRNIFLRSVGEWPPLGMALNASVIPRDMVHLRRIDNVAA